MLNYCVPVIAVTQNQNFPAREHSGNSADCEHNPGGVSSFMKTPEQIHAFIEANKSTRLCSLPDSEFETGGTVDQLARNAGYSSGRAWANEGNLWNVTLGEALENLEN